MWSEYTRSVQRIARALSITGCAMAARRTVHHHSSRRKRQGETESAPPANPVFRPNASAVTLHDALGNKETESHTTSIILGQLNEPVKNRLQLIVRNARACVADGTDNAILNLCEAHEDGPLTGRELECIAQ